MGKLSDILCMPQSLFFTLLDISDEGEKSFFMTKPASFSPFQTPTELGLQIARSPVVAS
jgi:hypothetical protein